MPTRPTSSLAPSFLPCEAANTSEHLVQAKPNLSPKATSNFATTNVAPSTTTTHTCGRSQPPSPSPFETKRAVRRGSPALKAALVTHFSARSYAGSKLCNDLPSCSRPRTTEAFLSPPSWMSKAIIVTSRPNSRCTFFARPAALLVAHTNLALLQRTWGTPPFAQARRWPSFSVTIRQPAS